MQCTFQTKSRFLHNKESEIETAPEGWRVTSCSNRGIWSRSLKYYRQHGVGDLPNHTKLHAFALFLFQKIPLCRRYHLCHPAYDKAMNWTFKNSCGLSPAMILSLKYLEAFASLSFQLEVLQSLFPYLSIFLWVIVPTLERVGSVFNLLVNPLTYQIVLDNTKVTVGSH